jgi:hypothetical protein
VERVASVRIGPLGGEAVSHERRREATSRAALSSARGRPAGPKGVGGFSTTEDPPRTAVGFCLRDREIEPGGQPVEIGADPEFLGRRIAPRCGPNSTFVPIGSPS